jgi:DNA-binding MarR family transcriptional regulator
MAERAEELYRLIVEIRRAFNELKTYSDDANADLGVTAAMRAVMEHLALHGPTSVPDIARAKSVTRQHIQQLSDALARDGLLEWNDNPRHKRSPLADLTANGRAGFAEIRKREAAALQDLAAELQDVDCTASADVLAELRAALGKLTKRSDG